MPGHKVVASKVMLRNNMEAEQLKAIIDYFIDKKHIEVMQPIFAINLDSLYKSTVGRKREDDRYDWQERNDLKNKLTAILCANEINGMTRYRNDLNFNIDQRQGIAIGGYRRMFHFTYPNYPNEQQQWIFLTPADSTEVKFSEVDSVFNLMFIHDGKTVESISLNGFVSFLKKKATQDDVPIGEMTLTGTGAISPGIIVTSIRIRHPESYVEDREVRKFQAWIMVK